MYVEGIEWDKMECIPLAEDRDKRPVLANEIINAQVA
jgi:hypothetical protein